MSRPSPLSAWSRPLLMAACCLSFVGCVAQSRPAKLQEAANDYNMATRFGRMDIAAEHVGKAEVEDFVKHHGGWGNQIRIVDVEFRGMRFSDRNTAAVFVVVGWQRIDEQELRVTHLTQEWKYGVKGQKGWKIEDEVHTGGDVGLLGEDVVRMLPERRADVHFPTRTIR